MHNECWVALRSRAAYWAVFVAILLLVLLVFWPALTGPFLFDDIPNLDNLGDAGGVNSVKDALVFIFSGGAGPLGRPLSLASFLLNAQNWPADPWPFKFTNLLVHMVNGVLVGTLVYQLMRALGRAPRQARLWALAALALWTLHPLHLSTLMLVVQRMTLLSSLCMLAGLNAYVYGRRVRMPVISAYLWMSAGIGLGVGLGVLCKENAILLPLLALVTEYTLLQWVRRPRYWPLWAMVFLLLPLLLLCGYFAMHWGAIVSGFQSREFTMMQRLLTEPRVLFEYLGHIFWPRAGSVFHDDYAWSRSLFEPLSTVVAIVAMGLLLVSALVARRRLVIPAFAILWFFAAHSLEASALNLELYFEHRNYLAMLGPVLLVISAVSLLAGRHYRVAAIGLMVLSAALAVSTWRGSQIWSSHRSLADAWTSNAPDSVRAAQFAARYWSGAGGVSDRAFQYFQTGTQRNPKELGIALQYTAMACRLGNQMPLNQRELVRRARNAPYATSVFPTLDSLLAGVQLRQCPGLTLEAIHAVIIALLSNPRYSGTFSQARLQYKRATALRIGGRVAAAVEIAKKSFQLHPDVSVAFHIALWAQESGNYPLAQKYLRLAKGRETAGRRVFHGLITRPPRPENLLAIKNLEAHIQKEAGKSLEK